jgi:hypothetical protein
MNLCLDKIESLPVATTNKIESNLSTLPPDMKLKSTIQKTEITKSLNHPFNNHHTLLLLPFYSSRQVHSQHKQTLLHMS